MAHKTYKKVILVILDGFGIASYSHGNAIALANPEALNFIISHYPSLSLQASGPLVGLPWGEVGNSEVGHLNIGAGRIVGQDLPRINTAIQTGQFFKNPAFLGAIDHVKKNQSRLHLVGLVSAGGVHSSDEHLYALLGLAAEHDVAEVYIHMFTDGRDTAEKVALETLQKLRSKIQEIGSRARLASVTGRFYAMDRGQHWDQTELTFQALVNGSGAKAFTAEDCILENYTKGIYDEMIPPTIMMEADDTESKPVATIQNNDAVIFFNFRSDRAQQLTEAFVTPEKMNIASRHGQLENLSFTTMTDYFPGLPVQVAFPPVDLKNNLAEVLSQAGLKQFHAAESEKYAHVTSFFNGGKTEPLPGEQRLIVKSPNNSNNYSDYPEMSSAELTRMVCEQIKDPGINFILANYANPDMVGHTGNLQAGIKAIGFLDRCLATLMTAALEQDAVLIITADHGNIEQMLDLKTGQINKDHTTSPVPFLLIANEFRFAEANQRNYQALSARTPDGAISDIGPTILSLFGLPRPPEMEGISLLDVLEKEIPVAKLPLISKEFTRHP